MNRSRINHTSMDDTHIFALLQCCDGIDDALAAGEKKWV
jgi:hypothetical protein